MSLTSVVGIGIISFLLLYFAFNLRRDEEGDSHFILRLILIFFTLMFLLLIPKVIIDDKDSCKLEISNITTNANVQTYEYAQVCLNPSEQAPLTLYKTYVRLLLAVSLYIFVFIIWHFANLGSKVVEWLNKK